jgi:hypothetical protein
MCNKLREKLAVILKPDEKRKEDFVHKIKILSIDEV